MNENWGYKEVIKNIETLKNQYLDFLVSFSVFERKKRIKLCREFKTMLYSLKFDEHKKNQIWRYINNEIEYEEIEGEKYANANKRNDRRI